MIQNSLYVPIIGSVIGIILIIIGIVLEKRKTVYSQLGNGLVVDANNLIGVPSSDRDQNGNINYYNIWNGNITVINTNDPNLKQLTFNINGMKTPTTEKPYSAKDGKNKISIWVNPNNPSDFRMYSDNLNIVGWVLLGVGIIVTLVVWISYFLKNKKK